jgi:hypothetical protein
MTLQEYKKMDLLSMIRHLEVEEDINAVMSIHDS